MASMLFFFPADSEQFADDQFTKWALCDIGNVLLYSATEIVLILAMIETGVALFCNLFVSLWSYFDFEGSQ
jgi:hypothetical protein